MVAEPTRRRVLWIELVVVLTLFFLPGTWYAVTDYIEPRLYPEYYDWLRYVGLVFQYIGTIVPVLFIVWASGDGLRTFGLGWPPASRTIPLSVACLIGSLFAHAIVNRIARLGAPDLVSEASRMVRLNVIHVPAGGLHHSIRIVLFVVGAFEEEFIMRGYLITRLRELLGTGWAALILSAALFSVYHIYEGVEAVVAVFLAGLVYGATFMISGSVWPGTIAHAVRNTLTLLRP